MGLSSTSLDYRLAPTSPERESQRKPFSRDEGKPNVAYRPPTSAKFSGFSRGKHQLAERCISLTLSHILVEGRDDLMNSSSKHDRDETHNQLLWVYSEISLLFKMGS